MSWQKDIDEIQRRRGLAAQQGGAEAMQRQHDKGRLSLRERIQALADPSSFREQGAIAGAADYDADGRMTGFTPANFLLGMAKLDGRSCIIGGEDFTVRGGSPTPAGLRKSIYAEDMALHYRVPLVRLHEGGGGSVAGTAGTRSAGPVGDPVYSRHRFRSVAETLATVPVVSAALGPVAGLPAARLVASHFTVMTKDTAQVLIAGPAVVERALGVAMSKEELGGAQVHLKNGVIDNLAHDEADAFRQIRRFLSYLPPNVWALPPLCESDDPVNRCEEALADIVPRDRRQPFDMRRLLRLVVDADSFFEMRRRYGPGQIIGLARMAGRPVGILANDCRYYAGAMTADGADKVRRFVEFCQTFHLPVLSFVDEPGFMIGPESERAGTIRRGTAAVLAVAACTVPWAAIHVRKSFGVAAVAHYGSDAFILSWPSAESGALPVEGGVAVAFGRQIAAADDPDAERQRLEAELAQAQSPFPRAESFAVHDLIDPRETRPRLCEWLDWSAPLLESQLGPHRFWPKP